MPIDDDTRNRREHLEKDLAGDDRVDLWELVLLIDELRQRVARLEEEARHA